MNKKVLDEKNEQKWERHKTAYQINRLDKLKQLRQNVINKQHKLEERIEKLKTSKAQEMFES